MEPSPPPLPKGHPASTDRGCRFNPWLFFSVLAAPAVVNLLAATFLGDDGLGAAFLMGVGGSAIAGIICGVHFARSMGQLTKGVKIGVGVAMTVGCIGGAFLLAFGGCALGANLAK